jgi:hypothetical protein
LTRQQIGLYRRRRSRSRFRFRRRRRRYTPLELPLLPLALLLAASESLELDWTCLVRVPLLCLLLCMFASFLRCPAFIHLERFEFVLVTPCLTSRLPLTSWILLFSFIPCVLLLPSALFY